MFPQLLCFFLRSLNHTLQKEKVFAIQRNKESLMVALRVINNFQNMNDCGSVRFRVRVRSKCVSNVT